jgi:hypothetical protein
MSGWDDLGGRGAPDFTVRPISSWPGEMPREHRWSQFKAPVAATWQLLARELEHLGARQVVVELAITEADLRLDGLTRARAIASHPGVVISFESRHGPLRYATAEFMRWQDNLRAIALGLEALRAVDRYGISRRGEQYRGWRALTTGADDEATVERGRALIREAGSVAAALHATHPDRGGNPTDLRSVLLARYAGVG